MPVNIITQWVHQIHRWAPEFRVMVYHGTSRTLPPQQVPLASSQAHLASPQAPIVVITTYGMLINRKFERRRKRHKHNAAAQRRLEIKVGSTRVHKIYWDRIVLDECHVIRNARTTRARYTLALQGRIHWGLTATPIHNGIEDYYCLLQFLGLRKFEIGQLLAADPVLEKYLSAQMRELVSGRILDLDSMQITSTEEPFVTHGEISLRRTKNQVFSRKRPRDNDDDNNSDDNDNNGDDNNNGGDDDNVVKRARVDSPYLPELRVDIVSVPFATDAEAGFYHAMQRITQLELEVLEDNDDPMVEQVMFELILRLRQCGVNPRLIFSGYLRKFQQFPRNLGPPNASLEEKQQWVEREMGIPSKTRALIEMIRGHYREEKAIVFCEFREEMPLLQHDLAQSGISSILYDGTMNLERRERVVQAMAWTHQELASVLPLPAELVDKIARYISYDVVVVQINSGNAGLNLQMCSRVYFTSPNWNPCTEIQAVSRSHRFGQTREVRAVKLVLAPELNEQQQEEDVRIRIDQRILQIQQKKRGIMSDILSDPDVLHNGHSIDFE